MDNSLDKATLALSTGLFALLIAIASFNVLVRQLGLDIFRPIVFWTDPISRYTLIIMTYIGVAIAYRNNENIKIDIVNRWLQDRNPTGYTVLQLVVLGVTLGVALATAVGAFTSAINTWGSTTDMPILTMGMLHLGIGFSFSILLIYTLLEIKVLFGTMREADSIRGGFILFATRSEAGTLIDEERIDEDPDIKEKTGIGKEEQDDE